MNGASIDMQKYLQSCKSEFWRRVFKAELDYIVRQLAGAKDILSVGCGPAIIETGLAEHGFNVTGLDVSREALDQAPDSVRKVTGPAEEMDLAPQSFDAVIYVASLQFIRGYEQAIRQTARVLRSGGRLLVMLLNPKSDFFKAKATRTDSYISKIRHTDLEEIEGAVAKYFSVRTEYFLSIVKGEISESLDSNTASLYVIQGTKKP